MTDTTPQSAGETPAAPPDPWVKVRRYNQPGWTSEMEQSAEGKWCLWARVQDALATKRQHHAAQLAEKDAQLAEKDAELLALRAAHARQLTAAQDQAGDSSRAGDRGLP